MTNYFLKMIFRANRATVSYMTVVVMLAFLVGLPLAACGSSNQNHTHSGEEIESGTVGEARIDASIARDSEVMLKVKANDGSGSGLDADELDGKSAEKFAEGLNGTGKAVDSDKLDGHDASEFMRGNITDHKAESDFNPTDLKTVHVSCPAGTTAVGGGALINTIPGSPIALKGSWPRNDGWSAYAQEVAPYDTNWSVEAYVFCAPASS
jgi:hypothetical protein